VPIGRFALDATIHQDPSRQCLLVREPADRSSDTSGVEVAPGVHRPGIGDGSIA